MQHAQHPQHIDVKWWPHSSGDGTPCAAGERVEIHAEQQGKVGAGRGQKAKRFTSWTGHVTSAMTFALVGDCEEGVCVRVCWGGSGSYQQSAEAGASMGCWLRSVSGWVLWVRVLVSSGSSWSLLIPSAPGPSCGAWPGARGGEGARGGMNAGPGAHLLTQNLGIGAQPCGFVQFLRAILTHCP